MIELLYLAYATTAICGIGLLIYLVAKSRFYSSIKLRYHGSPNKLKAAIRKADKLAKKKGIRYRVYFLGGRFRVYTRENIKKLKKSGLFRYDLNVTGMEPHEYYDTHPQLKKHGIPDNR